MKRIAILLALLAAPAMAELRPVTVDDLMKLRSIVDVKIAPDGEQVAYIVGALTSPFGRARGDGSRTCRTHLPEAGG